MNSDQRRMTASEVVQEIQAAVKQFKEQGHQGISIESLETYLDGAAKIIHQTPEEAAANLELLKINHDHQHQWGQAMFRSVIDSGQVALKNSILIGGGGVVAMLAFASSAWKSLKPEGLELLGWSVVLLALGVLLCGLSAGFTYLSQSFYHDGHYKPGDCREDKFGDWFRWGSIGLVLLSYGLYFTAAVLTLFMMKSFSVVHTFPVS